MASMLRLERQGLKLVVVDEAVDSVTLEINGKRIEIAPTSDGKFRIANSRINGDLVVLPNAANSINVDIL